MYTLFSSLPPEFRFVLLLVGTFLLTVVVIVAIAFWARVRRLQIEADLKTDMLERGLTPDEIRQVLTTPMRGRTDSEIQAELKERLVDRGLDGKQIKDVISAGKSCW
jgi:hypothetical protein